MKKLFRIKGSDSVLGGVGLGLADYFEIDVTIMRIILVCLFFTPVPIVLMYIIMWAIMPQKNYFEIPATATGTNY